MDATYREKYMEFHKSINSTDPAYLMICEDVAEIERLRSALTRIYSDSSVITERCCAKIAQEALECP